MGREKQGKKRIAVQPRDPAHRDSAGHFARRRATMIRNRSQILGTPSISASSPNHFVYLMGGKINISFACCMELDNKMNIHRGCDPAPLRRRWSTAPPLRFLFGDALCSMLRFLPDGCVRRPGGQRARDSCGAAMVILRRAVLDVRRSRASNSSPEEASSTRSLI